jgi:ABC-2 type transport system permease protein
VTPRLAASDSGPTPAGRGTASLAPVGPNAAPAGRRVLAQARFEASAVLRNGEQLLLIAILPALILVGLSRSSVVSLETGGLERIDVVAPGVLALAVMSTAFTSQAISTAFDRRAGVLRLLATTPLGRGGLLSGKVLAVLAVQAAQVLVLGALALLLGWSPHWAGLAAALLAMTLGTAAFTSLALLMAGTMRPEAVLATANLVWVLLLVGGGVVVPSAQLPAWLAGLAALLPSGALAGALRASLSAAETSPGLGASLLVLLGWAGLLGLAARRLFRWT